VNRVLRPARHIIGHFGDESFKAIFCNRTDNTKQTGENTRKNAQKQIGPTEVKHTKTHRENP